MDKRWIFLVLILAGIMVCGCAEEEADATLDAGEDTESAEDVSAVKGEEYLIRMEYYGEMKPSELEIYPGDTIVWKNEKKQGTFILISDDELFEEQEMKYGTLFPYTFSEVGTYTFSERETPTMTLTIKVIESN